MKKILYPLLVCGLFACSKKDSPAPQTITPAAVTDVTSYLSGIDSLSEFDAAFKKVTISEADASGGLTVFAPGNESIGSYDPGAKMMGKDLPDSVIKNHIVKGLFKSADLTDGKQLTTLSGKVLTVKVVDGKVYVNNVLITFGDGKAGSQIVHTVAKMLSTTPGAVDITVYDATKWSENNPRGELLASATVNLYLNAEQFQNGTPAFTAMTNNNGVVHFSGLSATTYFIVVKKGDLSNVWQDSNGYSYFSLDSVFQSQADIINSNPPQYSAGAGDFRFADLNQDGIVNGADKGIVPFRSFTVANGELATQKILIGYEKNSVMKLFTNLADATASLNGVMTQVGVMHKSLVMLDGMMSDDADCSTLPDWCAYDQFTFTAADNKINEIWTSEFTSVNALNRIILSLPQLAGDTTAIAAQARAMRAYVYLEMATYFGGMPVYTSLSMPANISRTQLSDTYAFVKNELLIALSTLPTTADVHVITKGAAKMLLARIAITNGQFSEASTYATELVQGNYSLVDASQIYASATSSEIVWDLSISFPYDFSSYWSHGLCPVARIAEAHLINAEAAIAMGNLGTAGASINLIRNRSGMPLMDMMNQDQARAALVDTYQKEYLKEGYRFRNLVRWQLAAQTLAPKGYTNYRSLLPIPMPVLDLYPGIVQNAGY